MNYGKVDSALAAAVEQGVSPDALLEVSVRTENVPDHLQQQELVQLGVQGVGSDRRIFSARTRLREVERLTDLPWVRLVSLAQVLRPLGQ